MSKIEELSSDHVIFHLRNTEQLTDHQEGRNNRNSKYRADCWEQENIEGEGKEGEVGELKTDTPSSRQKRERGRRHGGPCLWETSYYLGED